MNRVGLMASAGFGVAFLAACSDSPMEPTANVGVPKSNFAVGTVTNSVPVAVPGVLVVCKAGNADGSFAFTRTTEGTVVGSSITTSPKSIASGTCLEVANDNSPSGNGSHITVTEAVAANTTFAISCSFRGYNAEGTVILPAVPCDYANGGDIFLNHFHGYVITYTNTFTQGYYKNHENVVVKLLGTNGGYVVGGKLVVSADGLTAYTAAQIDAIYGTPPKGGNAELILLHQLMTAELNAKGGASVPAGVLTAINGARTLMNGGISSAEAAAAKAYADTLDAYNNGVTGPGHCD